MIIPHHRFVLYRMQSSLHALIRPPSFDYYYCLKQYTIEVKKLLVSYYDESNQFREADAKDTSSTDASWKQTKRRQRQGAATVTHASVMLLLIQVAKDIIRVKV